MPYSAKIELIVPLAFSLARDVLIFFKKLSIGLAHTKRMHW